MNERQRDAIWFYAASTALKIAQDVDWDSGQILQQHIENWLQSAGV